MPTASMADTPLRLTSLPQSVALRAPGAEESPVLDDRRVLPARHDRAPAARNRNPLGGDREPQEQNHRSEDHAQDLKPPERVSFADAESSASAETASTSAPMRPTTIPVGLGSISLGHTRRLWFSHPTVEAVGKGPDAPRRPT